jgi:hypothetical protein
MMLHKTRFYRETRYKSASCIQAHIRGYLAYTKYQIQRWAALQIQKIFRKFRLRRAAEVRHTTLSESTAVADLDPSPLSSVSSR